MVCCLETRFHKQAGQAVRKPVPVFGSPTRMYGVYSHDVKAAILVFQTKETAAIPPGIKINFYSKIVFSLGKPIIMADGEMSEHALFEFCGQAVRAVFT